MKAIKNDRASYKTRASIGSQKPIIGTKCAATADRAGFLVDRNGYFVWTQSPKIGSEKSRK